MGEPPGSAPGAPSHLPLACPDRLLGTVLVAGCRAQVTGLRPQVAPAEKKAEGTSQGDICALDPEAGDSW